MGFKPALSKAECGFVRNLRLNSSVQLNQGMGSINESAERIKLYFNLIPCAFEIFNRAKKFIKHRTQGLELNQIKRKTVGQILKKSLIRLQKQNPLFSLRAQAKKLGVSPPFLYRVLEDEAKLPIRRLNEFARAFQLDDLTRMQLERAILKAKVAKELKYVGLDSNVNALTEEFSRTLPAENHDLAPNDLYFVLSKWYHLAILDLATCKNFVSDPIWIGKRLGILSKQAQESLNLLKRLGLIEMIEDEYKKTSLKLRFPTRRSLEIVRQYHQQILQLGINHLMNKTSDLDYEKRLISGITFAADPDLLPKAKQLLNKALYEISGIMAKGECTTVYQLSGILFPLTKD
jgi:uncharacterized protein (TIGR02147 family)